MWFVRLYVMGSMGISRKSNVCHFQFSIWLKFSLGEVHFAEIPTWIIRIPKFPKVPISNGKIFKTIENKRNAFLFLAVSHNQCSRLLTDPARSHHMTYFEIGIFLQRKYTRFCTNSDIHSQILIYFWNSGKNTGMSALKTFKGFEGIFLFIFKSFSFFKHNTMVFW